MPGTARRGGRGGGGDGGTAESKAPFSGTRRKYSAEPPRPPQPPALDTAALSSVAADHDVKQQLSQQEPESEPPASHPEDLGMMDPSIQDPAIVMQQNMVLREENKLLRDLVFKLREEAQSTINTLSDEVQALREAIAEAREKEADDRSESLAQGLAVRTSTSSGPTDNSRRKTIAGSKPSDHDQANKHPERRGTTASSRTPNSLKSTPRGEAAVAHALGRAGTSNASAGGTLRRPPPVPPGGGEQAQNMSIEQRVSLAGDGDGPVGLYETQFDFDDTGFNGEHGGGTGSPIPDDTTAGEGGSHTSRAGGKGATTKPAIRSSSRLMASTASSRKRETPDPVPTSSGTPTRAARQSSPRPPGSASPMPGATSPPPGDSDKDSKATGSRRNRRTTGKSSMRKGTLNRTTNGQQATDPGHEPPGGATTLTALASSDSMGVSEPPQLMQSTSGGDILYGDGNTNPIAPMAVGPLAPAPAPAPTGVDGSGVPAAAVPAAGYDAYGGAAGVVGTADPTTLYGTAPFALNTDLANNGAAAVDGIGPSSAGSNSGGDGIGRTPRDSRQSLKQRIQQQQSMGGGGGEGGAGEYSRVLDTPLGLSTQESSSSIMDPVMGGTPKQSSSGPKKPRAHQTHDPSYKRNAMIHKRIAKGRTRRRSNPGTKGSNGDGEQSMSETITQALDEDSVTIDETDAMAAGAAREAETSDAGPSSATRTGRTSTSTSGARRSSQRRSRSPRQGRVRTGR